MNTVLFIMLVLYMAVNVYHDIKTLKTKNLWHLLFIVIFLSINLLQNTTQAIYLLSLAMIIGLTLERFQQQLPGDTKMLVVCSQALLTITTFNPYTVIILLYFIKMVMSSIWGFLLAYLQNKKKFIRDLKEIILAPFFPALRYSIVGQKIYSHPGAPFYLIACIIINYLDCTIIR